MKQPVDPHVADALHRLLVASVQDYAIFAVTADGHVASWNSGAGHLKGYPADEIIGQHLSVFYPAEERGDDGVSPRVLALLDQARREGRAEDEAWRVRRDGTRFWANVVITPIRDAAGTLLGFAKVTRDLTERRRAEEDARRLAAERAGRAAAERAEAEAGELQSRYRQLFEASPLPSWTVDLETLNILDVNEAAVERYGYSREEFSTLKLSELRDPSADGNLRRYLDQARVDGQYRGISRYRTKSGEVLDVDISARTIAHHGRPAVVAVLSDVTAQLRAEGRQRFLVEASALLGSSLDYEETLTRIVQLAVPTLADWAAYNTVDGDYFRSVAIHHADPEKQRLANDIIARYRTRTDADSAVARVLASGRAEFVTDVPDEVLRRVAHSEEHFEQLRALGFRSIINVPVTAGGRVLGVLGFALGESARRFTADDVSFAEELGRRAGFALDNALHFRAEQSARADAEAANRTKSEFLATMSHELRTPLNAIGGYTELIELGIHGPVTAEQRNALSRIQRSQRALLSLINEVLNFARLEAGAVQFDIVPVNVADALRSVEQFILPQVDAKRIRLIMPAADEALVVLADADKLGQVLLNLLSNAVKFTDHGGEITVTGRATPNDDGVDILVADTGIGIPSDQLERVFEPFVQVARRIDNPVEGTGLGLAISRDLARGMHGDLTAWSRAGEGSTFTLRLPAALAAGGDHARMSTAHEPGPGANA